MTPGAVAGQGVRDQAGESARAGGFRWGMLLVPSLMDIFAVALVWWLFASGPMGWMALLLDGDTGWHIRTGDYVLATGTVPSRDLYSFSKPGEAWFAWEWGADVLYSLIHKAAGLRGLVFLHGVLLVGSMVVMLRWMLWRGATFFVALPLTLIGVGVSSLHYLARPHAFTLFLLPVCLWLADADRRRSTRWVWLLIPVTAIWTNLHGGFLAIIACLGLQLAGSAIENLPDWKHPGARLKRDALLFAGCSAATLANPFGIGLHLHVAQYLKSDFISSVVEEFQSPRFRGEVMLQFELLIFAALAAVGVALLRPLNGDAGRPWGGALQVLYWTHQALQAVRHATVFVLVATPFLASVLTQYIRRWTAGAARKSTAGILMQLSEDAGLKFQRGSLWLPVLLLALGTGGGGKASWPQDFPREKFPLKLMHAYRPMLEQSRVLTMDQWADYLIYQSYPAQRVFVDGRSDFYGRAVGGDYLRLMELGAGWRPLLDKWRFDVALVPATWPLAEILKTDPGWRLVDQDLTKKDSAAYLFARKTAAAH